MIASPSVVQRRFRSFAGRGRSISGASTGPMPIGSSRSPTRSVEWLGAHARAGLHSEGAGEAVRTAHRRSRAVARDDLCVLLAVRQVRAKRRLVLGEITHNRRSLPAACSRELLGARMGDEAAVLGRQCFKHHCRIVRPAALPYVVVFVKKSSLRTLARPGQSARLVLTSKEVP